MQRVDDGGPIFPLRVPIPAYDRDGNLKRSSAFAVNQGMTLRQYAAITLCVPSSGVDWLDDMIREALRDKFAGQALAGILAGGFADTVPHDDVDRDAAFFAYKYANDMLAARKGGSDV